MFIDKPIKSRKYTKFLSGLKRIDPSLYKFAVENLSDRNYKWLMAHLKVIDPKLYAVIQKGISTKILRASHRQDLMRKGWEIAQKLKNIYTCIGGFQEKEVPQTATVILEFKKKYIGYIPELLQIQDRFMKDVAGRRKWTFSWDNRRFIANLTKAQIEYLRKQKLVKAVEISPRVRASFGEYAPYPDFDPNNENIDWGVTRLNTSYPWNKGIKGKGVKVCVCDTGIDYNHVDLVNAYKGGYNIIVGNDDPKDDHMHGTFCCGVVGARSNNIGYTGVAPECDIYAVKVLDSKGSGSFADLAAGIDWARLNGMDIVSMSLGAAAACSGDLKNACDAAWAAGLFLAVAAGNAGLNCGTDDCVDTPGNCESCMAVAAMDIDGYISRYSSRGPEVEISAPGTGITSCWLVGHDLYEDGTHIVGDAWYWANGTSTACPHIAGAAALIKCWYPDATNYQIRQWLREKVIDL